MNIYKISDGAFITRVHADSSREARTLFKIQTGSNANIIRVYRIARRG